MNKAAHLDSLIREKCVEVAQEILRDEAQLRIFLFGSRAQGKATARSDIDLGFDIGHPIPPRKKVLIQEFFDNLPILQKVDVIDFAAVDSNFKKNSTRSIIVLYERKIA